MATFSVFVGTRVVYSFFHFYPTTVVHLMKSKDKFISVEVEDNVCSLSATLKHYGARQAVITNKLDNSNQRLLQLLEGKRKGYNDNGREGRE